MHRVLDGVLVWASQHTVLGALASIALAVAVVSFAMTSAASWYCFATGLAFIIAEELGGRLYFYAFMLGMFTALAEILGKFRDEPVKALQSPHAFLYHVFNGAISSFALHVYFMNAGGAPTSGLDQLKAVLAAGFGSMLLMRSKLFNLKVDGDDVSFGPEQIVRVFFGFMEDAIDRVRAQSRIDFITRKLDNIDFDAVVPYCEAMLQASQTLTEKERKDFGTDLDDIRQGVPDRQLRAYRLGFLLLNIGGEDYVSKLFEKPRPEWWIKAPSAPKTEGLRALIQRATPLGDDTILYFAYGTSMSRTKLLDRLGWTSPQLQATSRPKVAILKGYRLAFCKPNPPENPRDAFASVLPSQGDIVEGVVYRLAAGALEFLDRWESGYHREPVKVLVDGKETDAQCYVADSPCAGLKPTSRYLDFVIKGAQEFGLSSEYVERLRATETASEESVRGSNGGPEVPPASKAAPEGRTTQP